MLEKDKKRVMEIYIDVFSLPPLNESWCEEEVEKVLSQALQMEGFKDYVAMLNDKLIGFSWGYKLPKKI